MSNFPRKVTEARATTGQTAYTVQTGYDATGQRTRVIYPVTNRTTLNSFDRAGRLVTTGDSKGSRNTVYTYDAAGNRLTITEPNGVVTTNTYDALNRCLTSFTRKGTTTVSDFTYAFDLVGNRLSVIENIASQGSRTIAYTYDARYQLLSEAWSGYSNTYVYDLAGNRLTRTNVVGTASTVTTSTYDALNRLLTSSVRVNGGAATATSYTYDRNGNQATQVTGSTTHTFTWDVHNRLISVTQGTNSLVATYDYRTRRETTNVNGAGNRFFRYDGGVSFHELLGNVLQVEFMRGPDMGGGIGSILLSDRTMVAGGVEETFAYNPAVGHVTALTNSTGATVDSDRYDAFGNIVGAAFGASRNNRQANTKERNTIGILTLDNHGFRYYNPITGRYISRDPKGYPNGLNNYLYTNNNPINRIDPLGLNWLTAALSSAYHATADWIEEKAAVAHDYYDRNLAANGHVVAATVLKTLTDLGGGAGDTLRLGDGTGEAIRQYNDGAPLMSKEVLGNVLQNGGRAGGIVLSVTGSGPVAKASRQAKHEQELVDQLVTKRAEDGVPGNQTLAVGRAGDGTVTPVRQAGPSGDGGP